jgi:hypothetical protein
LHDFVLKLPGSLGILSVVTITKLANALEEVVDIFIRIRHDDPAAVRNFDR